MANYRTRHAKHDPNESSSVFTPEQLDPQLDDLVDVLGKALATYTENHPVPPKDPQLSRMKFAPIENLQVSAYTSSFLFGLGILGFALSIPSLRIGTIHFDLPFLIISAFCTTLGTGSMMMVLLAKRRSTQTERAKEGRRTFAAVEWLMGTLGVLFLGSAMLVSSAYQHDTLVLPTVFRLGILGLTAATISLQLQYLKLVPMEQTYPAGSDL